VGRSWPAPRMITRGCRWSDSPNFLRWFRYHERSLITAQIGLLFVTARSAARIRARALVSTVGATHMTFECARWLSGNDYSIEAKEAKFIHSVRVRPEAGGGQLPH
jgi:hypothetical protein